MTMLTEYAAKCIKDARAPDTRIARAQRYAMRVQETPSPCRHGHIDCAAQDGGPCVDELFSLAGLDNDGEPYDQGEQA